MMHDDIARTVGYRSGVEYVLNPLAVFEASDDFVRVVSDKGRHEIRGRGVGRIVDALVDEARALGEVPLYGGGTANGREKLFGKLVSRLEESGLFIRHQDTVAASAVEQPRPGVVAHGDGAIEVFEAVLVESDAAVPSRERRNLGVDLSFADSDGLVGLEIERILPGGVPRHSVVVAWGDEIWVAESEDPGLSAAGLWESLVARLNSTASRPVELDAPVAIWSGWLAMRLFDDVLADRPDSVPMPNCWRMTSVPRAKLETHRLIELSFESQEFAGAVELPSAMGERVSFGLIADDFTSPVSFPSEEGLSQSPLAHSWCTVRVGDTVEKCEGHGWTIAESRARCIEEAMKKLVVHSLSLGESGMSCAGNVAPGSVQSRSGATHEVAHSVIGGHSELLRWNGVDVPEEVVCDMAYHSLRTSVDRWSKTMRLDSSVRGADYLMASSTNYVLRQGRWMGLEAALLELDGRRAFLGVSSDVDGAVECAVFRALCDLQGGLVAAGAGASGVGRSAMAMCPAEYEVGIPPVIRRSWLTKLMCFTSIDLCTVATYEYVREV